jgi:hypothetical protein
MIREWTLPIGTSRNVDVNCKACDAEGNGLMSSNAVCPGPALVNQMSAITVPQVPPKSILLQQVSFAVISTQESVEREDVSSSMD